MFVSSHALKRTSGASAQVADVALRLLNLAEMSNEPAVKDALVSEAQALLAIARELIATVDEVTSTNATPATSALINRLAPSSGGLFDVAKTTKRNRLADALLDRSGGR